MKATQLVLAGLPGNDRAFTQITIQLLDPDDPLGWHATDRLPPDGMRRSRRMDIRPGSPTVVDVLFRDSHRRPDGLEIIVHEYTLEVHIEPETATVLSCTATPRVLPWVECPAAVANRTPSARSTSNAAMSQAKTAGCTTSVRFKASSSRLCAATFG